jgi:hypothetical protein
MWVRWVVLGGIAVLLLWSGWVVVRGLIARDQLTSAMPVARELSAAVLDGEDADTDALVAELKQRADTASDMTHDPIWRVTEYVPWLGPNLTAVRQVTEIADTLTSAGLDPLISAASRFDPEAFAIEGGVVDLAPIVAIQGDIDAANVAMTSAAEQSAAIDADATIGPVRDAVGQLLGLVDEVTSSVDAIDRTAHLLPAMLGVDGPRNTLVLIQNNAEVRASGGVSGALALITTDGGALELGAQASTSDFAPPYDRSILELDDATASLYGDITGQYIQDVNLTPWFDTTARLAKAMWEDRIGGTVDAVVAVDPVLLSYLLAATGPVQVGDVSLTSENVVAVLLSETYARYPNPGDQDAFFAAAARAVFAALTEAPIEPRAVVEALVRGGGENRIRIWNARDDDQRYVTGTTLAGQLPGDNGDGPRLGVYLNDGTGAKMDYYLSTEVSVASGMCRPDGLPTYRVTVTLANTAPADAATSLPRYVTAGGDYGTTPGDIETVVAVYGPVDALNQGATLDGTVASGLAAVDRGRPAVVIPTELAPGESSTLTVEFVGPARSRGPLTVDTTPLLNGVPVQHHSLGC